MRGTEANVVALREREHLESFVEAFVERRRRDRWRRLFEQPHDRSLLRAFERHGDRDRWVVLELKELGVALGETDGVALGLYLDTDGDAAWLTLDDALERWRVCVCDALWSLVPGRLALVLHHEGWLYLCRRA